MVLGAIFENKFHISNIDLMAIRKHYSMVFLFLMSKVRLLAMKPVVEQFHQFLQHQQDFMNPVVTHSVLMKYILML